MSSAKITLIGFYGYDHTLFDNLDLPTGVEKDLLIDAILMRGGEYEVIYSNPDLLKSMIGSWSKRWKPVFANWQRATLAMDEIRPLDNYDRNETWTDSGTHSENTSNVSNGEHHDTTSSTSSDTMSGSGSTSGTDSTTASGSASGTDTVSAYDSNTLVNNTGTSQNNSSTTSSETGTTSTTDTQSNATNSGSANGTTSQTDTGTVNGSNSNTHTGHVYGNIGVTTSAAMFREFYDILSKYGNIYESIATVFLQAFVIPIL